MVGTWFKIPHKVNGDEPDIFPSELITVQLHYRSAFSDKYGWTL